MSCSTYNWSDLENVETDESYDESHFFADSGNSRLFVQLWLLKTWGLTKTVVVLVVFDLVESAV